MHLEGRDECVYPEVLDGESPHAVALPIVEALASSWGVRRDDRGTSEAV